jgi:flagellin-specific chaperone FliS
MNAPRTYFETDIATACPPKLRLLLLEAALGLSRRILASEVHPLSDDVSRALRSLRKILLHLFTSIESENDELASKIKDVYLYLYCTVAEAELAGETHKMGDVVQVLQIECETWRALTDRYLAEAASGPAPQDSGALGATAHDQKFSYATDLLSTPSRSAPAFDCLA